MNFRSSNAAWGLVLFIVCWLAGGVGAAAQTVDDDVGHADGYAYHVRYPTLDPRWTVLRDALHAYAATQKKDFIAAQADAHAASDAGESQLDITFAVARRTDDFISVLVSGSSFTGGAHPNPLTASFVLHVADNRLVAIADLFADADAAMKILSDEARAQLQGRFEAQLRDQLGDGATLAASIKDMRDWVARGTEAKPENFRVFLVDGLDSKAIGLTLVFPPYQVAAYVDGAPQVEVPARLFHQLLKPDYVGAFQWDTDAEKNGDQH